LRLLRRGFRLPRRCGFGFCVVLAALRRHGPAV
jgi:hypothetical protein